MSAVDINQINCATSIFAPINSKIDTGSIIPRQEQEYEPIPSSQTIDQKLAKIEDDVEFFKQLFKEIEIISHNSSQLKQLIHHPLIRARCYSLSIDVTHKKSIFRNLFDTFGTNILDLFLNFLEKNPNLQPDLECFISQQLVQLQLSLKSCPDRLGEFIVKFNSSKAIQQPLKAIFDRLNAKIFSPLQESQPLNLKEYHPGYFSSLSVKESAVRVAHTLDGTDFRSGGLRLWVHQPPKGKEGRATDLIIKNIQEFDTGRRDFIFKASSLKDIPLQNYKIVMLYILRCLKEDRAAYYSKYSNYLPDAIFEQITKRLHLNNKVDVTIDTQGQISLSDQDGAATLLLKENGFLGGRQTNNQAPFCEYERFQFEWAARKLIGLEERVKAVNSDQEILNCLNDFQEIYRELPNFNMDLTICTCISQFVFALPVSESDYKQAIHLHRSAVPCLISQTSE